MLRLLQGDTRHLLKTLPNKSVHCVVTSPPYYGLRRYLPSTDPNAIYEIGTESTVSQYIAELVNTFSEVWRVLRDDGTFFLNIGDSYNGGGMGTGGDKQQTNVGSGIPPKPLQGEYKHKDLMGVPWRLAFTLQNAGWYLRNAIIWAKPNPMPESATDRCTSSYEMVFMLTKQPHYFYDAEAIKEEGRYAAGTNAAKSSAQRAANSHVKAMQTEYSVYNGYRNKRDVWVINKEPYADRDNQHYAVMPTELALTCIKAGTSEKGCCQNCAAPWKRVLEILPDERVPYATIGKGPKYNGVGLHKVIAADGNGDLAKKQTRTIGWEPTCSCGPQYGVKPCKVLDPFMGAGTTLLAANMLRRDGIGTELNAEFVRIAHRRIKNDQGFFVEFTDKPTRPIFTAPAPLSKSRPIFTAPDPL